MPAISAHTENGGTENEFRCGISKFFCRRISWPSYQLFGEVSTMSDFKFIMDSGEITYICAESRKAAIEYFCKERKVPKDFVNAHCIVKNMGRVKNGNWI